jgi:predicted nuclease with TOPRIM domain
MREERPLLTADSPYPELLAAADAIDRAIVEGLSRTLGLTADLRAQVARAHGEELQKERQRIEKDRNDLQGEYNRIRDEMKKQVLAKWPEAGNRWHPVACELLSSRSEELVGLVESHPKFGRLEELTERIGELDTQKMDSERQWVKCQRLLRALETVALAGNLPRTASPELVERFARLRAAESGFFGPQGETAAGEGATVGQMP